jgi:hypothetical protein
MMIKRLFGIEEVKKEEEEIEVEEVTHFFTKKSF